MKVGIITFHFTSNQGASLQCYALKTWLEKQGHEVNIINYRPPYHTVFYTNVKNPFIYSGTLFKRLKKRTVAKRLIIGAKGFVKSLLSDIRQDDKGKYVKFTEFADKYFNQTKKYTSLKQLQNDAPDLDVYISGSDQLWNPDLLDASLDGAYFLDFGSSKTRKLTYAVSAKQTYTKEEQSELRRLIKCLDAVSLREENEYISEASDKPVNICIDPTLLLNEADYSGIQSAKGEKEPYVFVYGFQNLESINAAAHTVADKLNLKIVNGCPHKIKMTGEHEDVYDYGPNDFLSYMANADFVISNSFHATAFSIILKKRFVVIPHTTRGRRMIELLSKLGLSERLWTEDGCDWEKNIDYNAVYDRLSELRAESEKYLRANGL